MSVSKQERDDFVAAHVQHCPPAQIKALRLDRGWTQEELARRCGMHQADISALEEGKRLPAVRTLKRIASAFDVALELKFAPFSAVAAWEDSVGHDHSIPPAFDDDAALAQGQAGQLQEGMTE